MNIHIYRVHPRLRPVFFSYLSVNQKVAAYGNHVQISKRQVRGRVNPIRQKLDHRQTEAHPHTETHDGTTNDEKTASRTSG